MNVKSKGEKFLFLFSKNLKTHSLYCAGFRYKLRKIYNCLSCKQSLFTQRHRFIICFPYSSASLINTSEMNLLNFWIARAKLLINRFRRRVFQSPKFTERVCVCVCVRASGRHRWILMASYPIDKQSPRVSKYSARVAFH